MVPTRPRGTSRSVAIGPFLLRILSVFDNGVLDNSVLALARERFFLPPRLPPKSLSCLVKSRKAAGVNTNGVPPGDPVPSVFKWRFVISSLPASSPPRGHSEFSRAPRHFVDNELLIDGNTAVLSGFLEYRVVMGMVAIVLFLWRCLVNMFVYWLKG